MQQDLRKLEAQMLSQPGATAPLLEEKLAEARACGDAYAEAYALCLLGGCCFYQGDSHGAMNHNLEARDIVRRHGFLDLEARCTNALGLAHWRLGELPTALEYFHSSLALASELGDDVARCRVLNNTAGIYAELEDYERSRANFQEAVALARQTGRAEYMADAMAGLADTLLWLGEYDQALALLPDIKAVAQRHGLLRTRCNAAYLEAQLLHTMGRHAEGLEVARLGMDYARQDGDLEAQGMLLWVQADLHMALGDLAQARAALEQGEEVAAQLQYTRLQSELKLSRAKLHELLNEPGLALQVIYDHLALKETLFKRSRRLQSQAISRQIELEVLQREAQLAQQRNTELTLANERLQATQSALSYQASHDTLTGLLNRAAFWEETEERLAQRRQGEYCGIIFADLDDLKTINDTYGHAVGDTLIREIARRFRAGLRKADLVGRLSGDEFMVYLSHLAEPGDLERVAGKLLATIRQPFTIGSVVLQPSISLGSAVAPTDGEHLNQLHHHADLALYQAKKRGKNIWVGFEPDVSAAEMRRRLLKDDLTRAQELEQLSLHYQPQFLLPGRELVGAEALLRWQHPSLGWISPAEFIPLAEESRLIVELGEWALNEACRQAREWDFRSRGLTVSVNVSVRQFERPDLTDVVRNALRRHDLPGECVVLELTETLLYQDGQASLETVEALHRLGVRIAIDDFGTGYSSLRLLRQLPFRQLKIDRSFVNDLTDPGGSVAAARHFMEVMLTLAHGLGVRVVAEGVETQKQLDLLCELGCDKAQGYLLARPLPADALYEQFLQETN